MPVVATGLEVWQEKEDITSRKKTHNCFITEFDVKLSQRSLLPRCSFKNKFLCLYRTGCNTTRIVVEKTPPTVGCTLNLLSTIKELPDGKKPLSCGCVINLNHPTGNAPAPGGGFLYRRFKDLKDFTDWVTDDNHG